MSTAIAEVVTEPTLAELAETANQEHEAVCAAVAAAFEHAIAVGEALAAAKRIVPWGEWAHWIDDCFEGSRVWADHYIRIAHYSDELRGLGVETIAEAERFVRGLPAVTIRKTLGLSGPRGASREVLEEAQRLRDSGASGPEIAALLGCSSTTVYKWLNPAFHDRQRLASKHRKAKLAEEAKRTQRTQRDEAARKIGGSVAESYSQIRKTLQALDRAHADQTDREIRAALGAATAKLHSAEDEIVRALGIS